MESIISTEKVKELLPQKEPFVMVDHLLKYSKETITTGFPINTNNLFIEDGVFNESGMIENIAQSVALHTSYDYYLQQEEAPVGYIGTINNIQLFKRPKPNDYLITKIKILQEFMGITLVEGEVICNDEVLLKGKMKTFIAE